MQIDRRHFIATLGGAAVVKSIRASAQQAPRTGVISGRIVDAKGRAAVGINVVPLFHLAASDGTQRLQSVAGTPTNDRGEFRFFDLPPQSYLINFSNNEGRRDLENRDSSGTSQGLYPGVIAMDQALLVEVRAGEETRLKDIVLRLARFGSIRIRATNPSGTEPKDIQFGIALTTTEVSYSTEGTSYGEGVSIPSGQLTRVDPGESHEKEFWPTQPGAYQVSIGWKNAQSETEIVSMVLDFDGTSIFTELPLAKPERKLAVLVVIEKADGTLQPVKEISVTMGDFATSRVTYIVSEKKGYLRVPPAGTLPSLRTGMDGTASLPFPPGRYEITSVYDDSASTLADGYVASARQGNRDALTDGVVLSAEDAFVEIRMRIGAGTIRGTVRDRENRVVGNAQVALLPEGPLSSSKLSDLRKATVTKSDGLFELLGLKPGTYQLYAWRARGNAYRDPEFMKTREGKGTPVRIEESGRAYVDLRVLDD